MAFGGINIYVTGKTVDYLLLDKNKNNVVFVGTIPKAFTADSTIVTVYKRDNLESEYNSGASSFGYNFAEIFHLETSRGSVCEFKYTIIDPKRVRIEGSVSSKITENSKVTKVSTKTTAVSKKNWKCCLL